MMNRREFVRVTGALAVAAATPGFLTKAAIAKGGGKVVIVGGGAGGATVGRVLKSEARRLDVTVVETQPIYTTCFNSNHYFGGFRTFASLQHSYDGLRKLGITVATDWASDIDTAKKTVTLCRDLPGQGVASRRAGRRLPLGVAACADRRTDVAMDRPARPYLGVRT